MPFKKCWYKYPNKDVFARHHRCLSGHSLCTQLAVRTAFGDFTTRWTVSVARLQLKTHVCPMNYYQLLPESLGAVEDILTSSQILTCSEPLQVYCINLSVSSWQLSETSLLKY